MKVVIEWFRKKNKSVLEEYLEAAIIVLPIVFVLRTFLFGLYVVPTGSMESWSSREPASHGMFVGERFIADKLTVWFQPIERGEVISLNDPTYSYAHNPLVNLWQRYVWGPSSWTKRVIGIPGDHVQGRVEDGRSVVYVNDKKLDEPYVNELPLIYMWPRRAPTLNELTGTWQSDDGYRIILRTFDPAQSFRNQIFYRVDELLLLRGADRPLGDAHYDVAHDCWLRMPGTPDARGRDIFDVHLGPGQYWLMGDNRQNSEDSRAFGPVAGSLIHGRIKYRFMSLQYARPWSWLCFDESWILVDLVLHPIDFWGRVRWSRCLGVVQ